MFVLLKLEDSMGRPLSNDLRVRLVKAVDGGLSARAAGRKLEIAASTATGIVKKHRDRGHLEPLPMGGRKRSVLEKEAAFIEDMVTAHPDWSEQEMAVHLCQECGIDVHPTTVGRFVRKQGWRFKKNGIRHRTKPGRHQESPRLLERVAENLRHIQAGFSR
jgi:transposase